MKRICFIVAALVLVIGFTQCKKDNDTNPTIEGVEISLSVDDGSKADVNPGTGTVTFQDGDVIYVGNGGKYVGKLTRTSGVFAGKISDPVQGKPLYFYYLGNVTPTINGNLFTVSIANQTSVLPVISCGTSTQNYSSGISSYSSKLMNKCALVKFNVTTSSSSAICINGFNNKLSIDFSTNTTTPTKDGMGVIKLSSGNGEKWAVLLPQGALEAGEAGSAYSDDGSYNGTRGAVPVISENGYLTEGIQVQVANLVITHECVDLGLPSGALWATRNVGADSPEDYGDYFAWGETAPKTTYDWSTYQYCNGNNKTLTKYCNNSNYGYNAFTDNLTQLLPEDDAATDYWGAGWRIPTEDEWLELFGNTTMDWVVQNGTRGLLFTATNGNSLFLPAAGYYTNTGYTNDGIYGRYWSSKVKTSQPCWARYYVFDSEEYDDMYDMARSSGLPVRAIRSGQNVQSYTISVSASPSEGGSVSGGGTYEQGHNCIVMATPNTGYGFVNWTENGVEVSTSPSYSFSVTGNRNLVANFATQVTAPTGAINGKFSINANGDQVYFSQGNLQYIGSAATPYWKFAENQWVYLGNNGQGGSSQTVDRDLFGWGTSGYNHGANCYQPWNTSPSYSDYYAYGDYQYNLYDQTGQADWGCNPISNGGNQPNQWRTLSNDEWQYILFNRTTTSGICYARASVNNVNGVILLPDDWNNSYYTLNNTNDSGASYSSNVITASDWSTLELHGAVFLPAAGSRYNSMVANVGTNGIYWSSSYYDSNYAYRVFFRASNLGTQNGYRYYGTSVRLVCPVQ